MKQESFSKSSYGNSFALLTDLYELTMAYGYWKEGIAERNACFYVFFRKKPFHGEFAIAAGLKNITDFLKSFKFDKSDIEYLKSLKDAQGRQMFEDAFLLYLKDLRFSCDVDAVPEGTICFPQEPMFRVIGPILQAQLIESAILNIINFQTLIATKSSRVCLAAYPDEVIEFGLRRAQGVDGALSASRASFIGGCHATSNTLAGKIFGIPVAGTHAHSWVMAFEDEEKAFSAFGSVFPYNSVFLIDTYQTSIGIQKAVRVGLALKDKGASLMGVRLDSGDLTSLSVLARKLLDEAGLIDTKIMASNELDEYSIADLKSKGAKINLWGVGTNLVTGKEQPALDGVYKMSAFEDPNGNWEYKMKISDQIAKSSTPGILQVRRFSSSGKYEMDVIYDQNKHPVFDRACDFTMTGTEHLVHSHWEYKDLLIPIFNKGRLVYESPDLMEIRNYCKIELQNFSPSLRKFFNASTYKVAMDQKLSKFRADIIKQTKRGGI
ncbi:MAG: nicotinate phosphoribosyltransferase [Chlamydiae bacterium]|nr:nicotinate phosphoribosyltransferase [Chlamydiota bacterium]